MSIRQALESELQRLEGDGTWSAPLVVKVKSGPLRLECELMAVGTLGCSVNHVTLYTAALADVSMDCLKTISEALAAKLTYLLEPVAPIEQDDEGYVIQLRSDPPHREENERSYYEILVRRDQVSLRRYRKENKLAREQIPAQLTREVLGRLADDMVGVLPPN